MPGQRVPRVLVLVCRLGAAYVRRIHLRDEGHSEPHFFLIVFQDRLQQRDELLFFESVLFNGYVVTERTHKLGVVQVFGPSPEEIPFIFLLA